MGLFCVCVCGFGLVGLLPFARSNPSLSHTSVTVGRMHAWPVNRWNLTGAFSFLREATDNNVEASEHHDADCAAFEAGDCAPTAAASPTTTPQSPRNVSRGGATLVAGDDGRQGAKCKKLTRFVDDVHTVTPSSSVVICGDSVMARPGSRPGDVPACEVSARVDILTGDCSPKAEATSAATDRDRHSSFTRGKRHSSLSGKVSISNDVRLQTVGTPALQEMSFPGSMPVRSDAPSEGTVVEIYDGAISRVSICSEVSSAAHVMPQVETDKPVSSRQSSHSPSIDSQLLGNRGRSLSLSCSSLDKKLSEGLSDVASTGLESEDSASLDSRSLRRHSYELAYRHGRISPSLFDEAR